MHYMKVIHLLQLMIFFKVPLYKPFKVGLSFPKENCLFPSMKSV